MKFKIITILLTIVLMSCSEQKKIVQNNDGLDKKMAIINNPKYIKWITGKDFEIWRPEVSDLKKVDEILSKAIKDNQFYFLKSKQLSEIKKNYRQYLCYINEKGEKVIYINSMCELFTDYDKDNNPVPFDWKNKMIDISDGGECYWNIKINLTINNYYELKVNGIS